MIRINLLPGARKQPGTPTGSAQGWVIGYLVAAALLVVVLVLVYLGKKRELNEQLAANQALTNEITELERQSANIDQVRADLEQSRQLETVVSDLQRARYGPTAVLMEMSRILSAGGGPTVDPQRLEEIRRQNPLAAFNPTWDPRRLWLSTVVEEERQCTITGSGRTNEDIAEFLRRLTLSERFTNIELVRTQGVEDNATHLVFIDFELTAEVIY
ncbi:MAG: PilN domain-containing protein [Sandaracinaceae bacterium]|nr:PilN domain-containing protein [Sandaracinaceae bacterium]